MKKNNILAGIVLFILAVVFSIVSFVLPHESNGTFWSGYTFTMLAFLLQILFAFMAFGNADSTKKTFLGLPIAQLGVTYLLLQIIWGFVCIFVQAINIQVSVVVSIVLLGLYLSAIISAVIGKEVVSNIDTDVKIKTFFSKSILVEIEALTAKTDNAEIKSNLNKLIETVKYSDPVSSEALQEIEGRISSKCNELESAVNSGNTETAELLCKNICALFVERNKKAVFLK